MEKIEITLHTIGEVIDKLNEGEVALKIQGEDAGSRIYIHNEHKAFRKVSVEGKCDAPLNIYVSDVICNREEWAILKEVK